MVDLINGEFELNGFSFGSRRSGYFLKEGGFEVGPTTFVTQDKDNPDGDGQVFGRDYLQSTNYTFEMWVEGTENAAGWQDVSRKMSAFRAIWHGSQGRFQARSVDEMSIWHGDKPGLIYGRPRNYAEDRTKIRRGVGGILCDFAAVDDRIYEELWNSHIIRVVESTPGGLIAPFIAPITGTKAGVSRPGTFEVIGDAPTAAVVRFNGPVTSPRLTITNGWVLALNISLGVGEWVDIDTRPWIRQVLRNGSGSAAGTLTIDSNPLSEMYFDPGVYEMIYKGVDATNTSTATIWWRGARRSV